MNVARSATEPEPGDADGPSASGPASSRSGPRATQQAVDQVGAMLAGSFDETVGAPEASSSVERARSGDADELERIAREELPRVERLLRRLLGHRSDLDDLVQTVFLEMCRALPNFRGDSRLSTFVGGITVRVARRAMRPSAWVRLRAPMPAEPPASADRPDANAVAAEQMRRLQAGLGRLSADKRIAFVLWAFEGADVATIAETTGASVAATRSRIYYAQKELKAYAASDPYLRDLMEAP